MDTPASPGPSPSVTSRRGRSRQVASLPREIVVPSDSLVEGNREAEYGIAPTFLADARRRIEAGEFAEHPGLDPPAGALPQRGGALLEQGPGQHSRCGRRGGVRGESAVGAAGGLSLRQSGGVG